MRAIILAAAICSLAIGSAWAFVPGQTDQHGQTETDTKGDASRRQICMRHPGLYWCEEGPPFIANPKPPPHNGYCLRWPADPFCRDER